MYSSYILGRLPTTAQKTNRFPSYFDGTGTSMSMQKSLLRKRALAFGLDSVAENPGPANEESAPSPSDVQVIQVEESSNPTKNACFPIQETYRFPGGLNLATYYRPPTSDTAPLYICHHGAGSSGMTFWAISNYCMQHKIEGGFFVFDMRGHGKSSSPEPSDFSLTTLTRDFSMLIKEFHSRHAPKNPVCLVGHSLGGAVATDYIGQDPPNVRGLVVVDIVEETAVRSLLVAPQFLSSRPQSFGSLSEAVNWNLSTRLLRNVESAKVSVCDLLQPVQGKLQWRADFSAMKQFWGSWFVDLSKKFISSNRNVAKLLILSSNDTLDKDLMIGQMQGKYQLVVFNNTTNTGHFIQEDIPKQFVMTISDFMRRNDISKFMSKESKLETLWGGSLN